MSLPKLLIISLIVLAVIIVFFALRASKAPEDKSSNRLSIEAVAPVLRKASVDNVADGDSITVIGSDGKRYRIRLQGIDAPESDQAYGKHCTETLINMLENRRVRIEVSKIDLYNRVVGKVYVRRFLRQRDVNLEQVRIGCAWHYKAYMRTQSVEDRELYAKAEERARAARRGLWRDRNPKAPWDHRRAQRARR